MGNVVITHCLGLFLWVKTIVDHIAPKLWENHWKECSPELLSGVTLCCCSVISYHHSLGSALLVLWLSGPCVSLIKMGLASIWRPGSLAPSTSPSYVNHQPLSSWFSWEQIHNFFMQMATPTPHLTSFVHLFEPTYKISKPGIIGIFWWWMTMMADVIIIVITFGYVDDENGSMYKMILTQTLARSRRWESGFLECPSTSMTPQSFFFAKHVTFLLKVFFVVNNRLLSPSKCTHVRCDKLKLWCFFLQGHPEGVPWLPPPLFSVGCGGEVVWKWWPGHLPR